MPLAGFRVIKGDHRSSDGDLIQHVAFSTSLLGRFVRMALVIT